MESMLTRAELFLWSPRARYQETYRTASVSTVWVWELRSLGVRAANVKSFGVEVRGLCNRRDLCSFGLC